MKPYTKEGLLAKESDPSKANDTSTTTTTPPETREDSYYQV